MGLSAVSDCGISWSHSLTFWRKNYKGYFVCFVDFEEFQNLLIKQSPIEGYTEWLDDIVDKCVLQVNELNP